MTCQTFETRSASYIAGTLTESESVALELHASECAVCETLLEQRTARSTDSFAPAPPPTLREHTLSAVAARRADTRVRSTGIPPMRWAGVSMAIAAAALLMVTTRPREKQAQRPAVDSSVVTTTGTGAAAITGIADERARSEFSALDDAARELREALAATPNDAQLRGFLASVNARRAELERRVRDARS